MLGSITLLLFLTDVHIKNCYTSQQVPMKNITIKNLETASLNFRLLTNIQFSFYKEIRKERILNSGISKISNWVCFHFRQNKNAKFDILYSLKQNFSVYTNCNSWRIRVSIKFFTSSITNIHWQNKIKLRYAVSRYKFLNRECI